MKMLKIITTILLFLLPTALIAGGDGPTTPDQLLLTEVINPGQTVFRGPLPSAPVNLTINPAQKTLVLLVAGQSQWTNVNPTVYTPVNSSVIYQLNIYDGAIYPMAGDVLGSTYYYAAGAPAPAAAGNISVRVADQLVTNGTFNNVIIVNFAVGGTDVGKWAVGGPLYERGHVAMMRLAAQGITPSTTGVTFGYLWGQGEDDNQLGTSTVTYQTLLGQVFAKMTASGFVGRFFVCKETWILGTVSAAVQAAQVAIVDNVTIFSAGNLDQFGAPDRDANNTHFNDTGAPLVEAVVVSNMHSSGSPY